MLTAKVLGSQRPHRNHCSQATAAKRDHNQSQIDVCLMVRREDKTVPGIALKESCRTISSDRIAEAQELSQEPREVLARGDNPSVTGALCQFGLLYRTKFRNRGFEERHSSTLASSPFPVHNLRHVLAMLPDVVMMRDQFLFIPTRCDQLVLPASNYFRQQRAPPASRRDTGLLHFAQTGRKVSWLYPLRYTR